MITHQKIQTNIFKGMMPRHNQLKPLLLEMIEGAESHSINDSEERVTRTDMDFRTQDREWVGIFMDMVRPYMAEMCDSMMLNSWHCGAAWFFQYLKGEYSQWHTHPGCMWTNVYYLDLPYSVNTTVLSMPDGEEIDMGFIEEGMIMSFPSTLIHCSKPNPFDAAKTVIAFNTDFDDPYVSRKHSVV